ncbi:PorT family protein [Taibaiella lutea]|uniref:PorT family protein n=1 Tax=Taibaiella lutea TaxID=2608001 RepID=A0A5M6CGY0_9BACT|nr:porin family protein [Taibaiella lutea]KAA5533680.1 PorT family protein [Taibaiella lutea]
MKYVKRLTTSVLLLSGNFVFAQTTSVSGSSDIDSKQIRFGVYVAPTMSWMKPTTAKTGDGSYAPKSNGSKIGFTYGVMAEYRFADNYAIVTGLQVNMTGGKIISDYQGTATTKVVTHSDFNYRLNYLEVPAALKLRTDIIAGFRFFGQLGITTGFNIAKKGTYTVDYTDDMGNKKTATGNNEKIKGTLAIAPVMFSMNIGAGLEYPLNQKLAAYGGIFFNNGFAPDATNPGKYDMAYDLPFQDANTRLNNFALRIGLFF